MNTSHRTSVSFTDVAASFSEEEWDQLEQWQKDLYSNVMREIHNVLLDLGYHIENSDILFHITKDDDDDDDDLAPGGHKKGCRPNILLRINNLGGEVTSSEPEDSAESPEEGVCSSDLQLKIKQEDELYTIHQYESYAEESNQCASPVYLEEKPSYSRDTNMELFSQQLSESEDGANNLTSAEETAIDWSPVKTSQGSKTPRGGDTPEMSQRDRARRRKGIARQIKPIAALHDSDQNKPTEPKENELLRLPRLSNDCKSSYNDINFPFPHSEAGEEGYPYQTYFKGLGEEAPISFQQRGQTFIICTVCGKPFCNNSSYQVHMRTHTGERPYKCTDCEKSFIRSSHLKIHLRTHTGERPYQCSECEKSFRDNSSFARHQRIHTGEKPYQCATCGKYFRKKSNLKDHQRTHTGERPYKCKHCDKSFHQKSNLRVHERNHHAEDC